MPSPLNQIYPDLAIVDKLQFRVRGQARQGRLFLSCKRCTIRVEGSSAGLFRQVKWHLVVVAGVAWCGIWSWAIGNYWEMIYIYVFPRWSRSWIPLVFGSLMALVALGLWALAQRHQAARAPAPTHPR